MPIKLFETRNHRFCRHLIYLGLIALLSGCETEKRWQLNDVSGHLPDLQFSLTSDRGLAVTEQSYRGYPVMMFFGFTDCVSECPSTLFRLVNIVRMLGQDGDRSRILFVTLAPERDTPQVLHRYVAAFDAEHVIGLSGNSDEIEVLAKRYRAAFRPAQSDSGDIVHSTAVYVFYSEGHARLLMTPNAAAETVAADLRRLLKSAVSP